MVILVGCEVSGRVSKAFRELGAEAWSNDIQETRGDKKWHIKGDVKEAILKRKWDLIILHPPCTYLSHAGNKYYSQDKAEYPKRVEALRYTEDLWNLAKSQSDMVALENPVGALLNSKVLPKPYWVEPWMFGDGWNKKTGLWLYNLPPLISTVYAYERKNVIEYIGGTEKKYKRSLTPLGLAKAMAEQWINS